MVSFKRATENQELIGKRAYGIIISDKSKLRDIHFDLQVVQPNGMILGVVVAVDGEAVVLKCTDQWIQSEKFKTEQRDMSILQKSKEQKNQQNNDENRTFHLLSTKCFDYIQNGATLDEAKQKFPDGIVFHDISNYLFEGAPDEINKYIKTFVHPDLPSKKPNPAERFDEQRKWTLHHSTNGQLRNLAQDPQTFHWLTNQYCWTCKEKDVCFTSA